jgi:hypothetical protein
MGVMTVHRSLVLVVVSVAITLTGCGNDSDKDRSDGGEPSPSLPVVADETWCEGWQNLVAIQGQYVAGPTQETGAQLLSVVDGLQELGAPESLDPAGYTELTAVLDDIRASADDSFTPTVVPSEPADVGPGHDHDHGDEGGIEEEHREAPFGTWLADHCAA